jgi:predicted  nucleic acid-binding Zn-ribbon protein
MAEQETQKAVDVELALQRLNKAVSSLEVSVERRIHSDRSLNVLQEDLQRLGEDRSQLANDLDKAEARANRLEGANKDVSRRLVSAMETIRSVLDTHGG